ncbi:MAG TPA: hypothetical protein VFA70_09120 [Dehalococcoidia bacterium]|jgi:hypothetical protein|nr:hypothetical protein [Dehalococcoidia bacterium]
MNVQLDADEVWALLSTVTRHVLDEAGLGDEDRAALRRWRSEQMRQGSDGMKALVKKVNDDLERLQRTHERSQIQKHDWI